MPPRRRCDKEAKLYITDISYRGCVAYTQNFDLFNSGFLGEIQASAELPNLPTGHARIYDYRAGYITVELEKHLRPLFPGMPKVDFDRTSLIEPKCRDMVRGTIRSQWARNPNTTPEWNPLHVPCTYFTMRAQYDDLDQGPSFALFVCRRVDGDRLLVLCERPLGPWDNVVPPMRKILRDASVDTFQQGIPQDEARACSVFIKLLLLLLFQIQIKRMTEICQRTFPSADHEILYRGAANVRQTIGRIRNCTEYNKHAIHLVDVTEATASHLELEFTGSPPPIGLAEYVFECRSSSAQLARLSRDNMERYQAGWDTYREVLNVHESQAVKRLTMLATIFLPLSLASSILAMSTRLVDLHLLLYDFIGVFLVLSSIAFVLYNIITGSIGILRWLEKEKALSQRENVFTWLRTLGVLESFSTSVLRLFWIGLTVSFIIGMVHEVIFGLKFLGYFCAGMGAIALIAPVVLLVYKLYVAPWVSGLPTMRRGRRANPENGPMITPGASAI
ncbi:MAG: hypothetical protein Q9207_007383 [Kuettlingeria erythrocarpa]